MTFPIDTTIPATNNNPSNDQPKMQTNFANINSYVQVDHVNPSATGAGYHEQVTFNANNVPGSLPSNSVAVSYTNAGTASASSDSFFRNGSGIFRLNLLRACGSFTTSASPTLATSYNCASISGSSGGPTLVTLTAGATTGNNVMVIINDSLGSSYAYSFSGAVLSITVGSTSPAVLVSFFVFQI